MGQRIAEIVVQYNSVLSIMSVVQGDDQGNFSFLHGQLGYVRE
jgi:hypothetical protein